MLRDGQIGVMDACARAYQSVMMHNLDQPPRHLSASEHDEVVLIFPNHLHVEVGSTFGGCGCAVYDHLPG